MLKIKVIVTGSLKESYLREAAAEYEKRLFAYAKVEICELKECRLPEDPSPAVIAAALEKEGEAVLEKIPPRSTVAALCVEGKQLSSEELAAFLEDVMKKSGELTLIVGSSFGLSQSVKEKADLRLSFSRLTFPHQLTRVLLLETLYRSLSILHGGKYHK